MSMPQRERETLTVPATDFDDMNVFALNLDKPKSHTYMSAKQFFSDVEI